MFDFVSTKFIKLYINTLKIYILFFFKPYKQYTSKIELISFFIFRHFKAFQK